MISEAKKNLDIEKSLLRSNGYDVDHLTGEDYERASAEEKKMMDLLLAEQYRTQDPYERAYGKDWQKRAKYDDHGHLIRSSVTRPIPKELLADWEKSLQEMLDDDF